MFTTEEKKSESEFFLSKERRQNTIKRAVSISGVGLFSGEKVCLRLVPAKANTGIRFKRVDLGNNCYVRASLNNVVSTNRTTVIAENRVYIQCVEHLLSALGARKIDNIEIEIDHCEPPIGNGSSIHFLNMIQEAEVEELEVKTRKWYLKRPIYIEKGDQRIVGIPAETLKYSYTLSYSNEPLLDAQYYSFDSDKGDYFNEIAGAKTFALLREVKALVAGNVINSSSLDHGLVIDQGKIVNNQSLLFPNEMARHKILDMIGDFQLIGKDIVGHFIGTKSGHELNILFGKQMLSKI